MGNVQQIVKHPDGGVTLSVQAATEMAATRGDSVAVNGVCLTVVEPGRVMTFDVIPETLSRTNLGELQPGDPVNLESSLRVGDELGGHLVYGHVDATTVVLSTRREGQGIRVWCVTPPSFSPLVAEKGSVALDGVSLTVAQVADGEFAVALIPETLAKTTLGRKDAGSVLNLEADPIARYVAHILHGARQKPHSEGGNPPPGR